MYSTAIFRKKLNLQKTWKIPIHCLYGQAKGQWGVYYEYFGKIILTIIDIHLVTTTTRPSPISQVKRGHRQADDVCQTSGLDWPTQVRMPAEHDDVIKWKRFPRYWPFVRGIHRWPVDSRHKVQWRGALMFSLICAWTNGWVNNRDIDDLRRHRAHYDVAVMTWRRHDVEKYWPQRTHDAIITSLLRHNDVALSFWRNNDVAIASCVRWPFVKGDGSTHPA